MSIIKRYPLIGIAFGFCFPLFATITDLLQLGQSFSWENIYQLHAHNVLHIIIDCAPLILGIAGFLIGQQQYRLKQTNEQQEKIIQERTAELQAEKNRAEYESKAKSTFLSTISHEIRTPLNAVLGMNDLLIASHLDADQLKKCHNIKIAGNGLLSIVNDLLDFTKLESGKLKIAPYNSAIRSDLNSVIEMMNARAIRKGIFLDITFSEDFPFYVYADGKRITQIVYNLIGNAIKFTKEGKISIDCKSKTLDDYKFELTFTIEDTGIGIKKEKLEYIFEKFNQAGEYTTREYGGTGLGLSISRELARSMGGDCTADSTLGHGSTFTFNIIVEPKNEEVEETKIAEYLHDKSKLPSLRVLVAEDNMMNQQLIKSVLELFGYEPVIVGNGIETLDALKRSEYDLLLLDIQMPKMDGIQTAINIRNVMRNDRLVIAALTANAFDDDKKRALDAGMNHFLTKPLNQTELISTILNYFPAKQVTEV